MRSALAGLGLSLTGSGAWLWLMRTPTTPALGRICGHAAGQLHCPACYVAAAAAVIGLLVAAPALAVRPAAARV